MENKELRIFNEIVDKFSYIEQNNFPTHKYTYDEIISVIKDIKEKYFPVAQKYVTIEVKSEKESEVDDGIKDIEELVNNMNCPKMTIINIRRNI